MRRLGGRCPAAQANARSTCFDSPHRLAFQRFVRVAIVNVTSEVLHAVRRDLFPPAKFVWTTEVSVPGGDSIRRMDACVVNARVAPHYVDGLEVKVTRADWRNDLGGAKSKPARDATDRFWFVFGSPGIYKASEVPPEAGIIVVRDGRATAVRQPAHPRNVAGYDRDLLATVLTRVLRDDAAGFVKDVERKAEAKGYQKGLNAARRKSTTTTRRGAEERPKYNPGRFNFDDGVPLNLP